MDTILLTKWFTTISVQTPNTTNQYNQITYNTASNISGRLIETDEEKKSQGTGEGISKGEKIVPKAKLFTFSSLAIDTKVGDYKIISKKACKDKSNDIIFYKYMLG